jgi:hypothetical protein
MLNILKLKNVIALINSEAVKKRSIGMYIAN